MVCELAKAECDLYLRDLAEISEKESIALSAHKGGLYFGSPSMTDAAADHLCRVSGSLSIDVDGIQGISKEARSKMRQCVDACREELYL